MPLLIIRIEGTGGAFSEVCKGKRVIELPHHIPIRMETLDGGMQGGAPSIAFIIELPKEHIVVFAQTSVKLFQTAAAATYGKYGDLTKGAFAGHIENGTAKLTLSKASTCAACSHEMPGSFRYCPECGTAQSANAKS